MGGLPKALGTYVTSLPGSILGAHSPLSWVSLPPASVPCKVQQHGSPQDGRGSSAGFMLQMKAEKLLAMVSMPASHPGGDAGVTHREGKGRVVQELGLMFQSQTGLVPANLAPLPPHGLFE